MAGSPPPAVSWDRPKSSNDSYKVGNERQRVAGPPGINCNEPYAIYFCAEDIAPFVGTGRSGVEAFKKKFKKPAPGTIFDNGITYKALTDAGIKHWFLVTDTPENAALFKKYGAVENTLAICAPNGDSLGVFRCNECRQATIVRFCKNFHGIYAAYLKMKARG